MKTAREAAARLGRVGVWSFELERMTAADEGRLARQIEGLGFKALWIPESLGSKEIFAHAAILLAATKTLIVASGIANGGSDTIVDAIVAWGDVAAVKARVDAHVTNGADHVCLQVLGDDLLGQLTRLATAVL